MTRQAKATKQLLEMVTGSLSGLGLSEVDTKTLMTAATTLAIKVGDKAESELLDKVMDELSSRELEELGAAALLSSAAFLVTNGGERADESKLKRSELNDNRSKPDVAKRKRC